MPTDTDPIPFAERPARYTRRSLPPYRYLTGKARPHPVREGYMAERGEDVLQTPIPAPADWRQCEPYLYGVDLFNLAYWWEAHEAWEDLWKRSGDPTQRDFLQGLILVSAALLKQHLRQPRGAGRLLERAVRRLRGVDESIGTQAGPEYMGVNLTDWLAKLEQARHQWSTGQNAPLVLHLPFD